MRISSYVPSEQIFQSDLNLETNKVSKKTESFSDILKTSLDNINEQQLASDEANQSFIKGDDIDIADVMLKGAEASASLQFAVQVRNKLVEAYQEISRMQL